jgi:hypothetical protein
MRPLLTASLLACLATACGPSAPALDLIDVEPLEAPLSPPLTGVTALGGHLFALKGQSLLVWTVDDGGRLTALPPFALPGTTTDRGGSALVVRGERAWAWHQGRVWLLDIRSPASPTVLQTGTWDTSTSEVGPAATMGSDLVVNDGNLVDLARETEAWAALTSMPFRGPIEALVESSRRLIARPVPGSFRVAKAGATTADGWVTRGTPEPTITLSSPTLLGLGGGKVWVCHDAVTNGEPGLHVFSVTDEGVVAPGQTTLRKDGCRGRAFHGLAWVYSGVGRDTERRLSVWDLASGKDVGQLPLSGTTVPLPGKVTAWETRLVTDKAAYVESNQGLLVVTLPPR